MAYIKYKELAGSYGFYKELDIKNLAKYVIDYTSEGEKFVAAYSTMRDVCLFTDRKIVIYDVIGLGKTKKIHFIPYHNVSSSAILFHTTTATILLTMNSGYQLKLTFRKLKAEDKTKIRKIYYHMIEKI